MLTNSQDYGIEDISVQQMVKHISLWCLTDVACHGAKKPTTIPISKTIDKAIRLAPV